MIETTYSDPAQNGRVGVITPHGVLFRGSSEGRIRQALVEENLLDAVIGLPPNLFYGTGIPSAILIFKRSKADDGVLFIDASSDFEQGTNQNRLRDEDTDAGRRRPDRLLRPDGQQSHKERDVAEAKEVGRSVVHPVLRHEHTQECSVAKLDENGDLLLIVVQCDYSAYNRRLHLGSAGGNKGDIRESNMTPNRTPQLTIKIAKTQPITALRP